MAWCLVKHRDNFTFAFYFSLPVFVKRSMNNVPLETAPSWFIPSSVMQFGDRTNLEYEGNFVTIYVEPWNFCGDRYLISVWLLLKYCLGKS
jgi:hypothetical protein